MEKTVNFLENLIEEMKDEMEFWSIESVEEFKEITKDGKAYAELSDGSHYKKQGDIYIVQHTRCEDDYYGTIIKPITKTKALRIFYQC